MTNEYSYEIMYQYNIYSLYKMESGFYAKEEKVFIISNFTFQLSFINYYDHREPSDQKVEDTSDQKVEDPWSRG